MFKKVSVILVTLILIVPCFGASVFAADELTTDVVKGTPAIDGVKEDLWDSANPIVLTHYALGSAEVNAKPTVYTMWDENNLYVLADVKDEIVNHTGALSHEGDCVELFVDELNEKFNGMDKNDGQWSITVNNDVFRNEKSGGGYDERNNTLTTAVTKSDTGYIVEAAFPWVELKGKVEVGTKIGLHFQVDDDATAMGVRDGTIRWVPNSNFKAIGWGTATFVANPATPTQAPAAPTAPAPTAPANPPTGDSMAIIYAATVLSGSAVLFGLRKKFTKK